MAKAKRFQRFVKGYYNIAEARLGRNYSPIGNCEKAKKLCGVRRNKSPCFAFI